MKRIIAPIRQSLLPLLLIVAAVTIGKFCRADNHLPARRIHIDNAEVRYIPGKDGGLRFNVLYNNVSGYRFSLTILDDNGNQLYQEVFKDRDFNKVFRLADGEITGKLVFIIRNYENNSVQRFEVHAVDRMIQDVEIKKVQ